MSCGRRMFPYVQNIEDSCEDTERVPLIDLFHFPLQHTSLYFTSVA